MLIGYRGGEYVSEDISPLKYQYKIDLPSYAGSKKKEYLDLLEQTGIMVVVEYGSRVYLRRDTADGSSDMYSEKKEIKRQMSKRYSHFSGTVISQLVLGILMLVQISYYVKSEGIPFWIAVVINADLMTSGIIFFIMGTQKHGKYAMLKEEKDVWE